jgi:catechol 2,3-dioxygenase-like lactoylglutathione lyase family enzyme
VTAQRISLALPVDDLPAAVDWWSRVLGSEPTFVDGDRWAQFDLAGGRLALMGSDRVGDGPVAMVKVDDLDAAVTAPGAQFGPVEPGPHERRTLGTDPAGNAVVLYGS